MKLYNFYCGAVSWDVAALGIDLQRDEWRQFGTKYLGVRRGHLVTPGHAKAMPTEQRDIYEKWDLNEDWEIFKGEDADPYNWQVGDYVLPGLEVSLTDGVLIRYDDWIGDTEDDIDVDDPY